MQGIKESTIEECLKSFIKVEENVSPVGNRGNEGRK